MTAQPSLVGQLRTDRTLLAITGLSFALKLVLGVLADRNAPVLDEGAYLALARGLVEGGSFEGTFRPPLYPAFEALFLGVGLGTLGIRLIQVVLSTLSVLLVYRISHRQAGARSARIAAALVAFSPVLIAFSHRLWSETLFIFLLLLALDLLARPVGDGSLKRWVGAGLLLGLAALTRPMLVTFLPFLVLWILFQLRRENLPLRAGSMRFVALSVSMGLVILPWTVRNLVTTGDFVLIDSNGAFNVLVGAQPETRFVDKDDVWSWRFGRVQNEAYVDMVEREPGRAQQLAMDAALTHVRADPLGFAAKSWWEAGHLWTLDSFLLRHLRNRWYGAGVPGWIIPLVTVAAAGCFALVVLAGFAGLAVDRPSPFRGLVLLLLVQFTLLFAGTYALSRYAVPLQVLLAVPAGALLADFAGAVHRVRTRLVPLHRLVALGLVVAAVAMAWMRDLPLMRDMLVNGGANHRFRMEEAPTNQSSNDS
jgi:4-amino-4-deoxy-L-arabinose transferase-like glycosyltransferase